MIMSQRPSGLGRGLGALIPPKLAPTIPFSGSSMAPNDAMGERVLSIAVGAIAPNPRQPRQTFDHAQLEELITSVQEHGILQPLIVTDVGNGRYELIAGERRLRAATIAGLATVPVIVRAADDLHKLELALIENIQRQDLNPIEEAHAYQQLMETFGCTQEDIAKKVGKSRPQVANTIRLLQLPDNIQRSLMEGKISGSNARTLLSLGTEAERQTLFVQMLAGSFTVRETESFIPHPRRARTIDPNVSAAESQLRERLHNPVRITRKQNGSGDISIRFSSDEEFADLLRQLTSTQEGSL